jgi:fucose 4-O-acetylase-like acetyltransferase
VDTKNQPKERKYNYKLGYLRALAIIIVILAHTNLAGLDTIRPFDMFFDLFSPFSFAIPVFFFASGYFYEDTARFFGYAKKRFSRLVIPYYLWNIFYVVIFFVVTSIGLLQWAAKINLYTFFYQPWTTGDQYAFNITGWFVLCLFLAQIIYILIRKTVGALKLKNEYFLFAFFLALGLLGTYLPTIGFNTLILVFSRVLFSLPFLQFGYLYKSKIEKFDKPSYRNIIISIIVLAVIQVGLFTVYGGKLDYEPLTAQFHGKILQPFLSSFTGIWLCLQISTLIAKFMKPKWAPSRLLRYIGDNSWGIMINQFLGFWLLSTAFFFAGAPGFNVVRYKTDIFYDYLLYGNPFSEILYLVIGLFFPLLLAYCLAKSRTRIKNYIESSPSISGKIKTIQQIPSKLSKLAQRKVVKSDK